MSPPTVDTSVSLINADSTAPFLLVCDHASRALPARYGTLGLQESELWRHIAWDIGAADVTRRLAALLDAPAVLSGTSRLLVDCNRGTDDPTFICQVSDGTVVPGNRGLDAAEIRHRIDSYYEPYHRAIAAALERARRHGPAPALVSVHSFTPVMRGFQRPWHVGILWGKDPRLAEPLMRYLGDDPALVVGDNQPYSGRSNLGGTMQRHGAASGLPHVLIELRQDLIDTHHGAEAWASRLAAALRRLLAEHGPFLVERF
ncbi:MAG TPA: N-formylglutamate amidohydrolase [Candidatus Sulfotelmatobacter sp.]|nr:N-formylglutamate amidohydrolase [Candidatus Sulfotelmatobacter sp.]